MTLHIYMYNDQEFKDPASFNCIKMATALISGIHGNTILMQAVSVHSQQLQHASTDWKFYGSLEKADHHCETKDSSTAETGWCANG